MKSPVATYVGSTSVESHRLCVYVWMGHTHGTWHLECNVNCVPEYPELASLLFTDSSVVNLMCLCCPGKESVTLVSGGSYLASDDIFSMIRGWAEVLKPILDHQYFDVYSPTPHTSEVTWTWRCLVRFKSQDLETLPTGWSLWVDLVKYKHPLVVLFIR